MSTNTDMRVQLSWASHPKRRKLRRLTGGAGLGAIIDLWMFCALSRVDGSLAGMDDADIECAADWDGKPGVFIKALASCKLVDGEEMSRSVHDWADNNPWAAGAVNRSDKAKRAAEARWGKNNDAGSMLQACGEHAPSIDPHAHSNAPSPYPIPLPSPAPAPSPKPDPEPKKHTSPSAPDSAPKQKGKKHTLLDEKPSSFKWEKDLSAVFDAHAEVFPEAETIRAKGGSTAKAIIRLFNQGVTADMFAKAIRGYRGSDWHIREGHTALSWMARDTGKIEMGIQKLAESKPSIPITRPTIARPKKAVEITDEEREAGMAQLRECREGLQE